MTSKGDIRILPLTAAEPSDERGILTLEYFRKYYREYYGEKFSDLSFSVARDGQHIANVLCYKIDQKLCWPLDGIKVDKFTLEKYQEKEIIGAVLGHIEAKAKEHSCIEITIKDDLSDGSLSTLGEALFNGRYAAKIIFDMMIPFKGFDEAKYLSGIRKSYKSLVSWGKKNLEIKIVDKEHLSRSDFLSYKDFHLKISGRKTRSDESWDIQYEMIAQGLGELILAYYEGELAAGSLFIDQYDLSTYFTGVYERALFEFGISHYLLYYGICRAHTRGLTKSFSLGNFETDIGDPKWYNIQFFKKGFAKELIPTLLWTKNVAVGAQTS